MKPQKRAAAAGQLLTTRQAAERLGVTLDTIQEKIRSGAFDFDQARPFKLSDSPKSRYRIPELCLELYLRRREQQAKRVSRAG